jgi:hypothetical protein
MKIYITDIFPSSLKNKLTTLKEYLVNQNGLTKYELASEDYGMHYIENDTIYRVEPNFKPDIQLIKKFLDNEILVDNTDYKMIPVVSQLPLNYVLTKITVYEYQVSKKSKLKLVVECLNEPVAQNAFFTQNKQMDANMIPFNFYFVYNESKLDITDQFIKEDFNVFLSHLN